MQQAFKQKKPGGGSGPPGGGGSGPPGGGGSGPPGGGPPGGGPPGGGPPAGGQPPAAQQPIPPALDVKAMGSLPQIFYGDRAKADNFIEEVKGYFRLNADIPRYNSPYKKVAFTLTLVKGEETAQWVRNMGNWLDTIDPIADNIEDLWLQFLEAYAYQFQDSQAAQRARNDLKTCRMTNNNYDEYVSKFEALADKADYTRGSAEMYDMFLEGLPTGILYDMLKPPTPLTYEALKDKVRALAQGKAIIDGLLRQQNIGGQGGGTAYQRVNNNGPRRPQPQNQWRGASGGQRGGRPQYNSTTAPPSMNNTPVPMDLSQSRAPNNWRGRGGQRGWRQTSYQGRVAQGTGNTSNACFNCGQTGHYARNCPQKQRRSAQSNLIDFDQDEETEAPPKDKVSDLRSQISTMTTDERDQLIKELGEEEDFPTA